jgi:cardiolipin synthase
VGPLAHVASGAVGLVGKRVCMRLGRPGPVCPDRPTLAPAELESEVAHLTGACASPADVRFFIDGGEALAALEQVIDGATCRIDVLMYLWGDDEVGWRLARRLAARAGPTLPVRVLIDGGGNLIQGEPRDANAAEVNRAVCWLASQPHVQVVRGRIPVARVDHRKVVIVDGRLAWCGGRNFSRSAFTTDHDLSFTLAGPLAAEVADQFEERCLEQGGAPGPALPAPPAPAEPNALARVLRGLPGRPTLARALYAAVGRAEHHVYVENPYLSDGRMLYLLARARRRGADVRVVLTLQTGEPVYDRANRVTANRLLAAGVRVYLYPGVTHAKVLSVDGLWAYTGSGNFDPLSLRHNREMGLAISGGPAVAEVEARLLLPDLDPAWELTAPLPVSPLDYLADLVAGAF